MMIPEITCHELGPTPYQVTLELQQEFREQLLEMKKHGLSTLGHDRLILCEHHPILTLGSSAKATDLLIERERFAPLGIELLEVKRGGAITYHGPGQLVGYPILDLENFNADIRWYVQTIAKVIIDTLAHYQVKGYYDHEFPGVWILDEPSGEKRKISAVGIHLSRWVTGHGFSFNISNDLDCYQYFVPCAIREPGRTVTTLSREIGRTVDMREVMELVILNFQRHFGAGLMHPIPQGA
jgi:lipoyl(octanoyl) transferase